MPLYKYSWTPTNDGSGSGLDADLLDGNNSSYFQEALISGTNIKTINGSTILGSGNLTIDGGSGTVRTVTDIIPTNAQSVFNTSYTVGLLEVYINGVRLANADFTATNGTSVTLNTSSLTTADTVTFIAYSEFTIMEGVTLTGTQSMSNKTIIGTKEVALNLASGSNIDLSLGNLYYKTISASTTFTVSNVSALGTTSSFILDLTNGGSSTITWWANMKWASGTPPTLTASGRDMLGFITYDAGTTWNGLMLATDIK